MPSISSLPPEILREILQYLPVSALLFFGGTSKYHHAIQSISLSKLQVGVFPSRINAMISLLDAHDDQSKTHNVQIVLPKKDGRSKRTVIRNQNKIIFDVVDKYQHTLQDLEVTLWDLQSAAESIAKARNLRSLSIRLDHPHTRYADVDRSFWKAAPGSTVWNTLYGKGEGSKVFGRLESLNLERGGITDYQLQCILQENPHIIQLRLRKCLGLTEDFLQNLVCSRLGKSLRLLHFTHNTVEWVDERVLKHVKGLPSLTSLSLQGCHNIDSDLVRKMNAEQWHIRDLITPHSADSPPDVVEVDPLYK
ncbi:hypothetical protein MMC17_005895 [Xylographa soralifera]|nr:hypothetical protein [Xylographa soralifera]